MATFASPDKWTDFAKESNARSIQLKKEVEEGRQAQRYNKVFGTFSGKGKSDYAAVNSLLNMKEAEAEDLDQRTLDQYPKGAKRGSSTSRNRAEYGKPVDLPDSDEKKKSNVKEDKNKKDTKNMNKGGMVVANCGASMKPQQGRK